MSSKLQPANLIVIDNDEADHQVKVTGNRKAQSDKTLKIVERADHTKEAKLTQQFPTFNFNVLKQQKPQQIEPQQSRLTFGSTLNIVSDDGQIDRGSTSRNVNYSYIVEGKDRSFRSNIMNLIGKIEKLGKQEVEQKPNTVQIQEKTQKSESDAAGQCVQLRYFTSNEQKVKLGKCRRCGQYGHYQRNCTQEARVNCMYCLGTHSFRDCGRQVCFKCQNEGHMARDCTKFGIKCSRCGKIGHRQNECGTLILYDEQKNSNYDPHDLRRVLCLACGKKGHMNCAYRKIEWRGDGLYDESWQALINGTENTIEEDVKSYSRSSKKRKRNNEQMVEDERQAGRYKDQKHDFGHRDEKEHRAEKQHRIDRQYGHDSRYEQERRNDHRYSGQRSQTHMNPSNRYYQSSSARQVQQYNSGYQRQQARHGRFQAEAFNDQEVQFIRNLNQHKSPKNYSRDRPRSRYE